MLNYVIHAGGGFDNKGGAHYIDSYEELIKQVFKFLYFFLVIHWPLILYYNIIF